MEIVYPPVIGLARGWFVVQGLRFTVRGEEHVPREGGAVMAINHIGYLDFVYAGLAARRSGRLVRFMAKHEVFHHPISGPLMRGMHHIPVDRSAGSASYRAALAALKAGEVIGVFPEATISRSFELKEFKPGVARMAQGAGVPLLPTTLWGSHRVLTKDHRDFGRSRIPVHVYVGEPMTVGKGAAAADQAMTELHARMTELLHEAQNAYENSPRNEADRWWLPARLGGTAPTLEEAERLDEADRQAKAARRSGQAFP